MKAFHLSAALLGFLLPMTMASAEVVRHVGSPQAPILTSVTIPAGTSLVELTVFPVGDSKLDGKQDFKGFSDAYAQFFGTAAQPNKVARSTVQVAALANPGFLVEIEATAVGNRSGKMDRTR
jgi:hypothetical protein